MPSWTETLVASTARKVISANPKRISYTIQNESASDVYVGKNRGVAVSGYKQGIVVKATGGTIEDENYKGDVYVISSSGVTINVVEDVKGIDAPVRPEDFQTIEK